MVKKKTKKKKSNIDKLLEKALNQEDFKKELEKQIKKPLEGFCKVLIELGYKLKEKELELEDGSFGDDSYY